MKQPISLIHLPVNFTYMSVIVLLYTVSAFASPSTHPLRKNIPSRPGFHANGSAKLCDATLGGSSCGTRCCGPGQRCASWDSELCVDVWNIPGNDCSKLNSDLNPIWPTTAQRGPTLTKRALPYPVSSPSSTGTVIFPWNPDIRTELALSVRQIIAIIFGLAILVLLIGFFTFWYRRRQQRKRENMALGGGGLDGSALELAPWPNTPNVSHQVNSDWLNTPVFSHQVNSGKGMNDTG